MSFSNFWFQNHSKHLMHLIFTDMISINSFICRSGRPYPIPPPFPQKSPLKIAKVDSEFKQPYRQSFWSTACITRVAFKSHAGSIGKGVRNSNKDRSRSLCVRALVGALIIFHSLLFLSEMHLRRCCSDRGHLRSVRISIPRPGYIWFQASVLCAFRGANRGAPRARLRY